MYLLGKYYNSLIARQRKQLRLWKYFSFFHMTQFQFLVLYWNNFLCAKLSSSLISFSLCPNCLLSFPQCWRVLNVGKNSPGTSAHPPLVSTPTYMSTPCRDDSEVAHCCTIFLKSSGYRNIDDWHRNPNINIKEIIWLGNQLTQRVTRPSSSPITIDFTKQQFIRQYPGGVMVRVGGWG